MACSAATVPICSLVAPVISTRSGATDGNVGAPAGEQLGQVGGSGGADPHDVAAFGGEIGEGGLGRPAGPGPDDDAVDGFGDFGQDVTRDEDGPSFIRQAAQQDAEPVDAFGVEAVSGLVKDEDLRLAHQRGGKGKPLARPERELPDSSIGRAGQVDDIEHLVYPFGRRAADEGGDAEVVAGTATGIGESRSPEPHPRHGVDQSARRSGVR